MTTTCMSFGSEASGSKDRSNGMFMTSLHRLGRQTTYCLRYGMSIDRVQYHREREVAALLGCVLDGEQG